MVVKESKVVFDLSDLTAVRLECSQCGWILVWPTDKEARTIPAECPSCTVSWSSPANGRTIADQLLTLLCQIRNVSHPVIRVRLEMDDHQLS